MMRSPGTKLGGEGTRDTDERDRRLLVEAGGEFRARSVGRGRVPAPMIGVGATEGERLDAQRREDLELSRWDHLPSRSARAP